MAIDLALFCLIFFQILVTIQPPQAAVSEAEPLQKRLIDKILRPKEVAHYGPLGCVKPTNVGYSPRPYGNICRFFYKCWASTEAKVG